MQSRPPRSELSGPGPKHIVSWMEKRMPETKTVIVLANSVRSKPNACVAGREITEETSGQRQYNAWIRPVSPKTRGEVTLAERTLTNGREVALLDIVRMTFAGPQGDELQPENWVLSEGKNWEHIGRATDGDLKALVESPSGVWIQPDEGLDRVSTEFLKSSITQTLFLIQVPYVTLHCRLDSFEGNPWKRRRAIFDYRGKRYDLAFTDPAIESRFDVRFPPIHEKAFERRIDGPCYVCLSLAHEVRNNRHFKLVAALIDPGYLR